MNATIENIPDSKVVDSIKSATVAIEIAREVYKDAKQSLKGAKENLAECETRLSRACHNLVQPEPIFEQAGPSYDDGEE